MTDDIIRRRGMTYAGYLSGLSPLERERMNDARRQGEEEHAAFRKRFHAGECWICGEALTAFDSGKPCPHWLLKPAGFEKRHFELLALEYSLIRLEHYLRWVANEESFASNINDLVDEGSAKLVELTIKYKNLQWSFSCGAGDLSGHEAGGEHARRPHWHFQMFVDAKPFIRYGDFHAPLSEEDIGVLEHMRHNPGKVRRRFVGGTGMGEVLHESTLDQVVATGRSLTTDEEASAAPIELSTMIIAEPGSSIKGEDIYRLFQAAKAENVTVTSKLRELQNANITTIVSAGPGVVEQAVRSGGRKRKRGDRLVAQQDRAWRERLKRQTED